MRPCHRPAARRRAALRNAFALAMAGLAGAAVADSVPPSNPAPAPAQSTSASSGAVSPDPASLPNPAPFALPQLAAPQFRADASAPPSAAKASGPWGALSGDWQNQNLLGDMGGLQARPGQIRRPAHDPRERRDVRQSLGRRQTGFRSRRPHHRDAANGHREGVRPQGRHAERERPPVLGRKPDRGQSPGPADPDRHRGAGRRSALGAVVSAEIRRQIRRQDRRAEPR